MQEDNVNEFTRDKYFGPDQWAKYFGDVGACPPLPDGMDKILKAPCPIWSGRQVWETHKLFLVPRTVGGVPACLSLLGELIQNPCQGHRANYLYYSSYVQADLGNKSVDTAHWCLMTKDVIPGSKSMDYQDQRRFIAEIRSRLDIAYELPSTFQAALCILTHYVETGERIFARNDSEKSWTMTRCEEQVSADRRAVAVGGFEARGLLLYRSPDFMFDRHFAGTAGVLRFPFSTPRPS